MGAATLIFIGLSFRKPRTHRIFHYITAGITLVAAIAYFTLASNLGWTPIDVEFRRTNPLVRGRNREVFYVRYIDWYVILNSFRRSTVTGISRFITTPLLLLDLLLTAGLPWPTILVTILLDWVMVVTGLVGALVRSSYKWGYFAFGCVAFFGVAWNVTWVARKHSRALGADIHRTYIICGVWTIFLWFLYPVAWGLCEGGNVISPDSEAAFYGTLDVLAKPVFGALLLWGHRDIDPVRLALHIRDYDNIPGVDSNQHSDKHHNGVTNGAVSSSGVETA
ncbi:MAG: ion channel activity [Pleopsidium flavum]|nr:MAG: ion channel activity [Pleopsidium flavum]